MLRRLLFVGAVTGAVAAARDWAIRRNDARNEARNGAASDPTPGAARSD
jgi:hypothetical protein